MTGASEATERTRVTDSSVPPGGTARAAPAPRAGRQAAQRPAARPPGPDRPPTGDPAREAALDTLRAVRERRRLREPRPARPAARAAESPGGTRRWPPSSPTAPAGPRACSTPSSVPASTARSTASTASCSTPCASAPTSCCAPGSRRTPRSARPWSWCAPGPGRGAPGFVNAVLRRVAEHDRGRVGRAARAVRTTWAGRSPSPTRTRGGSRGLRARARGGDARSSERAPSPPTTPAPPCTSPPARARSPPRSSPRSPAARSAPYSPYGVCSPGRRPRRLRRSREGLAVVQDEGSQLVALAWPARPVDGADTRWLDLCAGPGGKAVMLGALVAIEGGTVDAVEVAPHRARLVEQATEGLPVTRPHRRRPRAALPEAAYDRVLVDAPCTGLGALRRRPEARWRRRPDDVAELTALQRELLRAGLSARDPAASSPTRRARRTPPRPPASSPRRARRRPGPSCSTPRRCCRRCPTLGCRARRVQLWPHRHGTDAMYPALLQRPA